MSYTIEDYDFDQEVRAYDSYFATAQTLPVDDSADGDEGVKYAGETNDKIECVVVVNTEVTIAEGDDLVLTFKGTTTLTGSSFVDLGSITITGATGGSTLAVGTELFRYTINTQDNPYVKLVITGETVTGKIDAFMVGKV